jgi:MFS family permease
MSREYQIRHLFKSRYYSAYAASAFLAMVSYGMSYIALTWIVMRYDNGGIDAVVMLMVCFWLPSVLLSPFAGIIVDKMCRRKLFIFTSFSRGLILLLLGLIEWRYQSLTAIYIMSILEGIVSVIVLPTVTTLVREIVPEEQLLIANTTIDMVYEVGNVVGMALAGFAVALLSNSGSLIADGCLFFIATFFAYKIKTPYRVALDESAQSKTLFSDIKSGFNYILKRREIKVTYSLELLALVVYMVVPVLTAPFAHKYLHATALQFGYLEAILSVGVVLGNLIAPRMVQKFGLLKILLIYNLILIICFAIFASNRDITIAYLLNFFIGIGFASSSLAMMKAQEVTNIDYQGRVSSSFNALSSFIMLLVYALLYFEGKIIQIDLLYYIQVLLALMSVILLVAYSKIFK